MPGEMMEDGRPIGAREKGPWRHVKDDGHVVPLILCVCEEASS